MLYNIIYVVGNNDPNVLSLNRVFIPVNTTLLDSTQFPQWRSSGQYSFQVVQLVYTSVWGSRQISRESAAVQTRLLRSRRVISASANHSLRLWLHFTRVIKEKHKFSSSSGNKVEKTFKTETSKMNYIEVTWKVSNTRVLGRTEWL